MTERLAHNEEIKNVGSVRCSGVLQGSRLYRYIGTYIVKLLHYVRLALLRYNLHHNSRKLCYSTKYEYTVQTLHLVLF